MQAHSNHPDSGPNDDTGPLEQTARHDFSEIRAAYHAQKPVRDQHALVCLQGAFVGRVIVLGSEPCTIGRHQSNTFWLPDPGVSRAHARVEPQAGGYVLFDQGSVNGTFVNGDRTSERCLGDGDLIEIGPTVQLRYLLTDAAQVRVMVGLYEASVRDPLTGAYNRDYMQERLEAEVAFSRRHRTELSLLMLDLDHFKRINDTHGHQMGDRVLTEVTATVQAGIRLEDVLVRYGGEEFVVILRSISVQGAAVLAERQRGRIEACRFEGELGLLRVTASFGCASILGCAVASADALVALADRRLLMAKTLGRNRVVSTG